MSIKKTYFCRAKDERHRIVLEHIRGDCLEGTGLVIPEGARAVIDKNATPLVGDLVHCNNEFCCINGFIKQVKKVGEVITVGTAYKDPSRDYYFDALEMYGVVLMVVDYKGNVVYTRSIAEGDT